MKISRIALLILLIITLPLLSACGSDEPDESQSQTPSGSTVTGAPAKSTFSTTIMLCPLIVKYFDIEVTLTNSKGEVTTTPFPTEPEEYMGEEMCILKLKDPAESLPSETQVSFTVTRNAEQPEAGTPIPVYIDFTSKLVVYDAKGTRIRGYQDHSYAEEEVMPTNNLAYMQEIIEETLYTLRAQVTAEGSGTLRSY